MGVTPRSREIRSYHSLARRPGSRAVPDASSGNNFKTVDRTERFYRIDQLLQSRRPIVTVREFLEELGVSLATFKRDLEYMRERLHAPIVWDRDLGGYRLQDPPEGGPRYELPGLWFNPQEASALLTMEHLIGSLEPTLLGAHLHPLKARLSALMSAGGHSVEEVRRRIRVITLGARHHEPRHFALAAAAVLGRQRITLTYFNRMRDEVTQRLVSPQRLIFYRSNWYLDAYCHLRKAVRSFALDAMRDVATVAEPAIDLPERDLDEFLASGYGIFAGARVQWALLKFSAQRARYVALEEWHPLQKVRNEPDGAYILEIPYAEDKELIMDILRYGPDVEVLRPDSLRGRVAALLERSAALYAKATASS